MERFEMVEKLREKAKVSFEEAKAALEQTEWDLLDAMVYLEKEGKVPADEAASFTTKEEPLKSKARAQAGKSRIARLLEVIANGINRLNKVGLEVRKGDKTVMTLPALALILLLVFMFWWVIPIAVVGLFFGFGYRFTGAQGVEGVNRVMDKASDMAENIRQGSEKDS